MSDTPNPTFRLNPFGYLFRIMWSYAEGERARVVLFYALQIIAMVASAFMPFALGQVINALQAGGADAAHNAVFWLLVMAGINSGIWIIWGPARHIERMVAYKVYDTFINAAYRKLTELPLAWHQDHHSGGTINRVRTASDALSNFAQDQYITIQTVVRLVFASAMLLWISVPVGVATIIALTLLFVVVVRFDKKLVALYHAFNESMHQLNAIFFDYVSNMTTLLTLRLTALSGHSFSHAVQRLRKPFVSEVIWNEAKWCIMDIVTNLISTLTLIYYILHTLDAAGAVALGSITMIYQYQNNLANSVRGIGMYYGKLVQQANSLEALDGIERDHKALGHPHRMAIDAPSFNAIDVHDLLLTRSRADGISFSLDVPRLTLRKGEKIALIGTSGGGKSTLLSVLCGIYAIDRGVLHIDGQEQPFSTLNDVSTLIPQDPEIFENTIRFNITLGVEADDAEIMRAVRLAGFDTVLAQLPEGLATDIREKGVNLSVGQKQRLALARGFFAAAHSAIVLLDEPTSSVDLHTEEALFTELFSTFPDKAIVASMHRLHLLPQFDRILLMQNGKLVVDGTARDLLSQPGPVRDLFERYGTHHDDAN